MCCGPATASADEDVEELVVTADLDSLPDDEMRTVFGFGRSLLDTPRSASTVSDEMMARFNIRDIDELIALAPGSFTQSFFGVAGTLDIRGTTGETYFRGIRRLDNPGNYPTPIGASERVDIVRGPASPIHGPAKIGGYLNFNPKSARIEATGEFIEEATGSAGVDFGSWGRRIATAEVGGPGRLGGEDFGYWLYAEAEDSGSYYDHGDISQTLVQASFDMDVRSIGPQFGGMFHEFTGTENAGWNRLTQDLIDTGTYITGSPMPLDADGDGRISHQEFDVDGNGFTDLNPFAAGLRPGTTAALGPGPFPGACSIGTTTLFGCRPDLLALDNVGTARIEGSQVLIAPEDELRNEVLTLYFDVVGSTAGGWEWRNQAFYESYDNVNEVAYGFSSFHDAAVFEDKLVLAKRLRRGRAEATVQFSPSVRVTDFDHGDDFTNEYFDRRDLTKPASALDRRLLATQIDDDYSRYHVGDYLDLGLAVLVDADWRRLNVLTGLRYDSIDFESRQPVDKLLLPSATHFLPGCVLRCRRGVGSRRRRVLDFEREPRHRRRHHSLRHDVEPGNGDRRSRCRHRPGQHRRRDRFRQLHAARAGDQGQPNRRDALPGGGGLRTGADRLLRPVGRHQPGGPHHGAPSSRRAGRSMTGCSSASATRASKSSTSTPSTPVAGSASSGRTTSRACRPRPSTAAP